MAITRQVDTNPLSTVAVLPELSGRRFASVTLGEDKITLLRSEHMALRELAALVIGENPEKLTLAQVREQITKLEQGANDVSRDE